MQVKIESLKKETLPEKPKFGDLRLGEIIIYNNRVMVKIRTADNHDNAVVLGDLTTYYTIGGNTRVGLIESISVLPQEHGA